jgi:hypothetical protein
MYDLTGEITTKFDGSGDTWIVDAIAGTGREIDLQVGSAGTAGHFGILIDEAKFQNPTKDYGGDAQTVTVPFTAVHNTSGNLCTFTVSDGVDQSW